MKSTQRGWKPYFPLQADSLFSKARPLIMFGKWRGSSRLVGFVFVYFLWTWREISFYFFLLTLIYPGSIYWMRMSRNTCFILSQLTVVHKDTWEPTVGLISGTSWVVKCLVWGDGNSHQLGPNTFSQGWATIQHYCLSTCCPEFGQQHFVMNFNPKLTFYLSAQSHHVL